MTSGRRAETGEVNNNSLLAPSFVLLGLSLMIVPIPVLDLFSPVLGGLGIIILLGEHFRTSRNERSGIWLSAMIYLPAFFLFLFLFFAGPVAPAGVNPSMTPAEVGSRLRDIMIAGVGCSTLFQLAYTILPYRPADRKERSLLRAAFLLFCAGSLFTLNFIVNGTIYMQPIPGSTADSFGYNWVNLYLARFAVTPGVLLLGTTYFMMASRFRMEKLLKIRP